jgi:hypothetical protein
MNSELFSLHVGDFIKGAFVAVFSAVVVVLYAMVQAPDFSFASMDWNSLGLTAFSAFIGYLAKNFVSERKATGTEKVVGVTLPEPSSAE